jgi:hypothetical protein
MTNVPTIGAARVALMLMALACASPASAQYDLSGSYNAIFHEDQPERVPGPSLGDYLGLPINENARAFAEAWDASRLTVPEHQCRAHSSPYILRGPLNMRIWEERHPERSRWWPFISTSATFNRGEQCGRTAGRIPLPWPNTPGWVFRPDAGRATRWW